MTKFVCALSGLLAATVLVTPSRADQTSDVQSHAGTATERVVRDLEGNVLFRVTEVCFKFEITLPAGQSVGYTGGAIRLLSTAPPFSGESLAEFTVESDKGAGDQGNKVKHRVTLCDLFIRPGTDPPLSGASVTVVLEPTLGKSSTFISSMAKPGDRSVSKKAARRNRATVK